MGFSGSVALFRKGVKKGTERAGSPSSIEAGMSRDRVVSVPVRHIDQKGWIWLLLELLYLFIFKLKTIVVVPVYLQEKKGTLKESDKAVMTAFDAIVNFCEELG